MGLFDNLSGPAATTQEPATQTDQINTGVEAPGANDTPVAPATDPVENTNTQLPNPNSLSAADAPVETAPTPPVVNHNSILDTMSGGLIKDEEGFKAVLPKLAQFDTLQKAHEELSAKMAAAPVFADDEVRIYNELKTAGASKEQLRTFQQINDYGNISEMPDREARIAKMVMIDGMKPSVAELKVDRELKLNDEEATEEDREIAAEDLRVSANNDRKALEKFKAAVSQANTNPPEEVLLQQQAALKAHQDQVKPYAQEVIKSIPNLGTFDLSAGKDGAIAMKFELPLDDAIRSQMAQHVENYFIDGTTPVTPETTREALNYARAEYFREHAAEVIQNAFEKGVSLTTEALEAKYENRSGLKPQVDNPVLGGPNAEAATAGFMQKVANRNT